MDSEDDDEDVGEAAEDDATDSLSPEQDLLQSWMERASSFNNVCRRFSRLCDKLTIVENRELFFALNSYLCNVQVILSGKLNFIDDR